MVRTVALVALPGRVHVTVESCLCLEPFMWLVNQHRVHWRRNRLQQFALSPWDSYPERLVNTGSVFDNLWVFECRVWRRKGGKYAHVKCSDSGYCSNWKSKGYVVCFSVFISSSNRHANPWFFLVAVGIITTVRKVHIVRKIENVPAHQIPEQKFIKTNNPQATELYCSMACHSYNAF